MGVTRLNTGRGLYDGVSDLMKSLEIVDTEGATPMAPPPMATAPIARPAGVRPSGPITPPPPPPPPPLRRVSVSCSFEAHFTCKSGVLLNVSGGNVLYVRAGRGGLRSFTSRFGNEGNIGRITSANGN